MFSVSLLESFVETKTNVNYFKLSERLGDISRKYLSETTKLEKLFAKRDRVNVLFIQRDKVQECCVI